MSILGAVCAFIGYVVYGVWQESRMASMSLFPAIVQRAIVDQGGQERTLSRLEDMAGYHQLGNQFASIPEGFLADWPGDCSLPLNLMDLDPYSVPGTFQVNLDFSLPKVIVFFYGPVPDVSPYLDLENQDNLLARRPSNFRELPSSQLEWLTWVDVNEQEWALKALTNKGRIQISWRGEKCERYSYIIFEGQRL
jgi:hypothetical protein